MVVLIAPCSDVPVLHVQRAPDAARQDPHRRGMAESLAASFQHPLTVPQYEDYAMFSPERSVRVWAPE